MHKIFILIKSHFYLVLLIIIGSVSWSLTMVKSGLIYDYGMGFWGPNGHDGVWHIALTESLVRNSFELSIFSGQTLKNYHIGFDVLLAMMHKLTLIPVVNLYFQIVPPLLAIGIGVTVYRFVFAWKKSKTQALWSTFMVYFGGGWGYAITLIRSQEIGGESMFWSQQSISTLINPPFALSLLFLFVALELIVRSVKITENISYFRILFNQFRNHAFKTNVKGDKTNLVIASFLFGLLIQIKAYAGVLILGGLLAAGLYQTLIKREGIILLKVFSSSLIISLLIFLPLNSSASSTFEFQPFWFLETMMQISDRLNWTRFGEAMIHYRMGGVWWKAIPAYLGALIIFWYGNLGSRILNELYFAKKIIKKDGDYIDIIIFTIIVVGLLIPTFFVQTGTPWNTIQFLYYSLIFSSVVAGIWVGDFLEKQTRSITKFFVGSLLLIVTIPTTLGTLLYNYIPSRPPAKISIQELEALSYLEKQPHGIVLTYPYDKDKAQKEINNPPRPLYLYESTAYVSAFSKKPVFLEDEVNLNITGFDWYARRKAVENFLQTNDIDISRSFLRENKIMYIYWIKGQRALLGEEQLGLEKLFENDIVDIYKVLNEK